MCTTYRYRLPAAVGESPSQNSAGTESQPKPTVFFRSLPTQATVNRRSAIRLTNRETRVDGIAMICRGSRSHAARGSNRTHCSVRVCVASLSCSVWFQSVLTGHHGRLDIKGWLAGRCRRRRPTATCWFGAYLLGHARKNWPIDRVSAGHARARSGPSSPFFNLSVWSVP